MESNKKFYDGEKSAGALQLEGGFLVIFSLACAKQGKRERGEITTDKDGNKAVKACGRLAQQECILIPL
jgi:hypothetical protein